MKKGATYHEGAAVRQLTRENIKQLEGARHVIEAYCVKYRVLVPGSDEARPILMPATLDRRDTDALTTLKWLTREIELNIDQLRRAEREMSLV